jgi:hypothetical protein
MVVSSVDIRRRMFHQCSTTPPHVAACKRLQSNDYTFKWSWYTTLEQNDRGVASFNMKTLRGIDGAYTSNVDIVAKWNQSNWPAILQSDRRRVNTASTSDFERMCHVWKDEHSYQSFPVLLGCPQRTPQEFEPMCANQMALVRIPCAAIDLTSDTVTAGSIFDNTRWWRVTHSTRPPRPCVVRHVERYRAIASALSVYPTSVGHFVPEQLPKILLMHRYLPKRVPILVADHKITRRYLTPLIDSGIMPSNRIIFKPLTADGTIIYADSVYTVLSSHFSNIFSGESSALRARDVLDQLKPYPVPPEARSHILFIERSGARHVSNHAEVIDTLTNTVKELSTTIGLRSLRVRSWTPKHGDNMTSDIWMWRHAALIVGPHGAGLANMLYASHGTPVIELCYDATIGMPCPAMYAALATLLQLPYWVVTGVGSHGSTMRVDITQLRLATARALQITVMNRTNYYNRRTLSTCSTKKCNVNCW